MSPDILIRWTDIEGSPVEFPVWVLSLFPDEEIERIERFVREKDRRLRYAADALLHRMIGETYGIIDGLQIVRGNNGKPYLSGAGNADIGVSHSGDIVVCALSTRCRIGIDIERIQPVDIMELSGVFPDSLKKWFQKGLVASDDNDRDYDCFFRAWTRLESVIKADGRGFGASFGDLSFDDDMVLDGKGIWYLDEIPVSDGYRCCLASADQLERREVVHVERVSQYPQVCNAWS